jgi:MFS family permease
VAPVPCRTVHAAVLPARLSRIVRALTIDVALLRRRRDFGLLTAGQVVSQLGSMMTFVALPVQCYAQTHSTLTVGLLGAVEFLPIVSLALVGGALADGFDRRLLVIGAEAAMLLVTLGLVANASLGRPTTWALFVAAGLSAAFDALRRPPLDALQPRLVAADELMSASALSSALWSFGSLIGPALAGLAIASVGFAGAYAADAVTFLAALGTIAAIRTPGSPSERRSPSVRSTIDAVRYASGRPELIGTYVVDMNAMFFGMPLATFPALAHHFGGGDSLVGVLYAAPAAGAVLGAATSGWSANVRRHGRAIVVAATGWGVAIVGFGLAPSLAVALVFLVAAGAADEISGIFRSVIWNQTIPDAMRGRLAGLEMLSWSSGPTLGNVEAGVASALVGLRSSIVLGGVLCVAGGGALTASLPAFWAYDAREPPDTSPPPPPRVTAAPGPEL